MSWINPINAVGWIYNWAFPRTPEPPLSALTIYLLGVPNVSNEQLSKTAADLYGFSYISLWSTIRRQQELPPIVSKYLEEGGPCPCLDQLVSILREAILKERSLLNPRGFFVDIFPVNGSDIKLLVDALCPAEAIVHIMSTVTQKEEAYDPLWPTEQQKEIYKSGLELIPFDTPRVYNGEGLSGLNQLQTFLLSLELHVMDTEIEDLISKLPYETAQCVQVIAKNLINSKEQRYRILNISTDRFKTVISKYPSAMRALERLGFHHDHPKEGQSQCVEEPSSFVCHLVSHLCEAAMKRNKRGDEDETTPPENAFQSTPQRPRAPSNTSFLDHASPDVPSPTPSTDHSPRSPLVKGNFDRI